jgi:uncharacterized repeat protein (TIGR03809 family)
MTYREDVTRSRDIFARWRALAERRLDHLTELFESGRWRRYYSEHAFLENISEAKTAVEIWRGLATGEASRDNAAIKTTWLGRGGAALPRVVALRDHQVRQLVPQPAPIVAEPLLSGVSIAAETGAGYSDEAPSAPDATAPMVEETSGLKVDLTAIELRYPLLRNAL